MNKTQQLAELINKVRNTTPNHAEYENLRTQIAELREEIEADNRKAERVAKANECANHPGWY